MRMLMGFCDSVIDWFSVACGNVDNFLCESLKKCLAECKRERTFCGRSQMNGLLVVWLEVVLYQSLSCLFLTFLKKLKKRA